MQINQAGFTADKCFIFDQICRRDRTDDCLYYYTEEIRKIHEEFVLNIRRNMSAVVEICWGVNVRNRMKKLVDFSQLNLWGSYEGVELYLEFSSKGEQIIRFVLFVNHPQYFVYAGRTSEAGMNFRQTKARLQDLHLTAAARLGGMAIEEHFYESLHRPGSYGKLTDQQKMVVQRLEAEAIAQLKEAVPEKFRRLESSALYEGIRELKNEVPRIMNTGNYDKNEVRYNFWRCKDASYGQLY